MPDKWIEVIVESIPCVSMVAGKTSINYPQIVSAVIGAIVIALLTSYITVQKMEVSLDFIVQRIEKIEARVEKMHGDIYKPHVIHK